jgi:toxin ParE1/3/4
LDIVDQALFIGKSSARTAERFFDAVEGTLQTLSQMPGMGAPRDFASRRLKGMRMMPVDGFEKHLIFYMPVENGIEVVRVLHASRDIPSVMVKT